MLKLIGTTGFASATFAGSSLAQSPNTDEDGYPATDYESRLDDTETEALLRKARPEKKFQQLKRTLSKEGYKQSKKVKGYHVEVPSKDISFNKIHALFNNKSNSQTVRLIFRFRETGIEAEAQEFVGGINTRVTEVYHPQYLTKHPRLAVSEA